MDLRAAEQVTIDREMVDDLLGRPKVHPEKMATPTSSSRAIFSGWTFGRPSRSPSIGRWWITCSAARRSIPRRWPHLPRPPGPSSRDGPSGGRAGHHRSGDGGLPARPPEGPSREDGHTYLVLPGHLLGMDLRAAEQVI